MDVAASAIEKMAANAEETTPAFTSSTAPTCFGKAAGSQKAYKKRSIEKFEKGVRPSFEQTADLAAR